MLFYLAYTWPSCATPSRLVTADITHSTQHTPRAPKPYNIPSTLERRDIIIGTAVSAYFRRKMCTLIEIAISPGSQNILLLDAAGSGGVRSFFGCWVWAVPARGLLSFAFPATVSVVVRVRC